MQQVIKELDEEKMLILVSLSVASMQIEVACYDNIGGCSTKTLSWVRSRLCHRTSRRLCHTFAKSYRGHRDRMRVEYMKTFPNTMRRQSFMMRLVALEPVHSCIRPMSNKQYLHDAFEGDIIVSESNSIGSDEDKMVRLPFQEQNS